MNRLLICAAALLTSTLSASDGVDDERSLERLRLALQRGGDIEEAVVAPHQVRPVDRDEEEEEDPDPWGDEGCESAADAADSDGKVTLQPNSNGEGCGDCIIDAKGNKLRNTGDATIKACVDDDGNITDVDLGESGEGLWVTADPCSNCSVNVIGGGSCELHAYGDGMTFEITMGNNPNEGLVEINGDGNTVNNHNDGYAGTTFASYPSEGNSNQFNDLPAGDPEYGNHFWGTWTY